MLGAVAGDIIGSVWEGSACADLPLPLIQPECSFTDDTVCTVAIADALLHGKPVADTLRAWVRRYPNRGYGGSFHTWAHAEAAPAYQSYANGGAMRVSPAALLATSEEEVLLMAQQTAAVTHNHPDGMNGAQAIALAIWYARQGMAPAEIRERIQSTFAYSLKASVRERQLAYGFSVLAVETVPDALVAALEATSYEGAIRNAIAIGGDSDTVACMAGGIAEALFGMPQELATAAMGVLPFEMQEVLTKLYEAAGSPLPLVGTFQAPAVPSAQAASSSLLGRLGAWLRKS